MFKKNIFSCSFKITYVWLKLYWDESLNANKWKVGLHVWKTIILAFTKPMYRTQL